MSVGGHLNHWADILAVVAYFVFVLAVGLWSMFRLNRGSLNGYFLAGKDMTWFSVGASLFASNIGSEHFIGLAGTAASSGIAVVIYEWLSLPLVIGLAWFFLPVYMSAGVFTLPEYLEKRFGGNILRIYISCLALLLYVVTKIAVSIYAGALFIQLSLGWNMYLSIGILLIVTCIYTALGGLAAVMYTDTLQTVIMTLGAVVLCIISFAKVGGFEALQDKYSAAIAQTRANNTTCGLPDPEAFHIFRDPIHGDHPWPGLFLQASIGCLWYWCADQVIVQRMLSARTLSHAKGGAILAGYLKILPLYLMIFPGMISRVLYPDEVGCVDADECQKYCDNPVGCSNMAYPKLVMTLMPIGVRGLLAAVMMSAIMSSLTSIFNSASTLFTMDIWRKIRSTCTERELLIVGRMCILVLCGVSILWVPLVQSSAGGQLFVYIQAVQGYLGAPIGIIFLMAIFWRRTNGKGALLGLIAGHSCELIRMVMDFAYRAPECGQPDSRPVILTRLHYTYFSQINILFTSIVVIVVSLITKPQDDAELATVTWWTRNDSKPMAVVAPNDDILLTVVGHVNQTDADDNIRKAVAEAKHNDMQIRKCYLYELCLSIICGTPRDSDSHFKEKGTECPGPSQVMDKATAESLWNPNLKDKATVEGPGNSQLKHTATVAGTGDSPLKDKAIVQGPDESHLKDKGTVKCPLLAEKLSKWQGFININAVIALVVLSFLIGFYH